MPCQDALQQIGSGGAMVFRHPAARGDFEARCSVNSRFSDSDLTNGRLATTRFHKTTVLFLYEFFPILKNRFKLRDSQERQLISHALIPRILSIGASRGNIRAPWGFVGAKKLQFL